MSKFQQKNFSSIHKIWWHEWVWMKTCPPEVFGTPYHTHRPITRKTPLHFQDLVKKWHFLTNFFTSTKICTCLVNKCWPKFFHEKKALIFSFTTLTSNFSYLLWSRKYFVLKIQYTRVPFSNNYLQIICSGWFQILTNMRMYQVDDVFFILNPGTNGDT